MFNKKNNKEETINMVEETFFKKHGGKIFAAGTVVTIAGLVYIMKKHGIELNLVNGKLLTAKDIALRSLMREKTNAEYEIAEKMTYINKLDETLNINIFNRIPEAEKRIAELESFIQEINNDIAKLQD